MHLTLKRIALTTGVAVAAVAAIGATTASATTAAPAAAVWHAAVGTTVTGTGTYTAATTGTSPQIALKDTTTGTTLNCVSGTAKGNLPHLGTVTQPIATITGTTWTTCTGPLNLTFTVTQAGTWNLTSKTYTGPTSPLPLTSGTTGGTITGVSASVSGPGCSFTVTGSTDGTFTNGSTQALKVTAPIAGSTSKLTISAVSGCFGLVANGDTSTFAATYKISAKTSAGVAGNLSTWLA